MSEDTVFMGSADTSDVHVQGSAVANDLIKIHKEALQGHSTCIEFEKNRKQTSERKYLLA